MPSVRSYTALIHVFLVLVASSIGLAVYYQKTSIGQNAPSIGSDPIIDGTGIANFNGMILNLDTQISQLTAINSSSRQMESQVSEAQLVASTPSAQAAQLDSERLQLQSLIGQSQPANLVGSFFYRNGFSYSILYGVYVNTGLSATLSANVIFTFYSQPTAQGTTLCSLIYHLGNVVGHAVTILGRISCGIGTVGIESVTYQFEWS